jgi:hypothetical protein
VIPPIRPSVSTRHLTRQPTYKTTYESFSCRTSASLVPPSLWAYMPRSLSCRSSPRAHASICVHLTFFSSTRLPREQFRNEITYVKLVHVLGNVSSSRGHSGDSFRYHSRALLQYRATVWKKHHRMGDSKSNAPFFLVPSSLS